MNRKFLQDKGLEADVIDDIMAEYGKAIQSYKDDLETKKGEVDALQTELNDFKDKANRVDDLEEQLDTLKGENKDIKIEAAIKEVGGKDVDYLKFKLGEVENLNELPNKIENLKKELPRQFKSEENDNEEDKKGYRVVDTKLPKGEPAKLTKDQIMKIEDKSERQKKIAENLDLFN